MNSLSLQASTPAYLYLVPGSPLPEIGRLRPFRAVIIIEAVVVAEWQAMVSNWLVRSGCLYTMAWGKSCSSWDDSVDIANIESFDHGEIPEEGFVMTTLHDDEQLSQAFRFCKDLAFHPTVDLDSTLLSRVETA